MAVRLFEGGILESGECQSTLNEDIRTLFRYNSITGSGETGGERLARDLGVADGPDTLQKLRRIPASEILRVWSQDRQVHFDAIVDGWIVPEQPAKILAEEKEMLIPVLVGSNADEATVFGHGGPKTVGQYRDYLRKDIGSFSNEEFQAYAAGSDADVPTRYLQLQSDWFAYGAYSLAQATARAGQKAYLYYFTYTETGKRAPLGAYHGEELSFLSESFPSDWEKSDDDEKLGERMRTYWTQFAKTGNPNTPDAIYWAGFDANLDQCFELGRRVGVRPVAPQARILEHIMNQIFAETMHAQPQPKSEN
jgi:para-nitrobenzyl esterase